MLKYTDPTCHPKGGYGLKTSPRENQVIKEVLTGKSNKQIGSTLGITEKTIKFHLTSIYKKLRIKSRHQLIVKEIDKKTKASLK